MMDQGHDPDDAESRRWLAQGAEVSPVALGQILNEYKPGSIETWIKMLEFLEIDVELSNEPYTKKPELSLDEAVELTLEDYVPMTKYLEDKRVIHEELFRINDRLRTHTHQVSLSPGVFPLSDPATEEVPSGSHAS